MKIINRKWDKENRKGAPQPEKDRTLPTYIRNFIHHPENTQNTRYTFEQLKESIELMRTFIQSKK